MISARTRKIFFVVSVFFILIPNSYIFAFPPEKITLKTGEVYVGEIIIKNDEIILIRTKEGERYQFPVSSVKSIVKITDEPIVDDAIPKATSETFTDNSSQNIRGFIEVSGGTSSGLNCFPSSFTGDVTLSFGATKIGGKMLFAGLGSGFSNIYNAQTGENLKFVPLFIHLQSNNLSKSRTSPYLSLDAGYAFSVKSSLSGGTFGKLSGGIIHRLNVKTSVNIGVYARAQNFQGQLNEIIGAKTYYYTGNSSILGYGLIAGFQF